MPQLDVSPAPELDIPIEPRPHPRTLGWKGVAALGMGGSSHSLLLIGLLIVGRGSVPGQWTAAIPIMLAGSLFSWLAAPGWIELVLMSPRRVGGIAASCCSAFYDYSPILSALTGVSYWWGWVPACGASALLSATAINQWVLPNVPVTALAGGLIALFVALNLCGIKWVGRVAIPIAVVSAVCAFVAITTPILTGAVDWQRATNFSLNLPFPGWFGRMTSIMAGLYLFGFGARATEAATCYVAETMDCVRNVPRAVFANTATALVYSLVLPLIWIGALGAAPLAGDLGQELGPTFARLFGAAGKSVALGFIMFNLFHVTIQPLAGAARTLSQLAEDGLLPRLLAQKIRASDAPWFAILATGVAAIGVLLIHDPLWLIAATNFTYLIGIALPSVAVWLLRRDAPKAYRPWRAPRGTIFLGLVAACAWALSILFGCEQFGVSTVVIGLALACSGGILYALRLIEDRRQREPTSWAPTLYSKLAGAMLLVLGLDAVAFMVAVTSLPASDAALIAALTDIFVAVATLTLAVATVLPGMIAHSAGTVSLAARRLARGTVRDLSKAMAALGRGDLERAKVAIDIEPVPTTSSDELGQMGRSFNELQQELKKVAEGMTYAREGLTTARNQLIEAKDAAEAGARSKTDFLAVMSHELRTPLNGVIGMAGLLVETDLSPEAQRYAETLRAAGDHLLQLINDVLDFSKLDAGKLELESIAFNLETLLQHTLEMLAPQAHAKNLELNSSISPDVPRVVFGDAGRLRQVLMNLLGNAIKFTEKGSVSVKLSRLPTASGELQVCFEVQDSGIGVPGDRLKDLFLEFSQVDTSMTRRYGGTGLGLAISRKLVEKMGGEISAESIFGQGSTFRFTARLRPSLQRATSVENAGQLAGRSFLVVDDTTTNRDIMVRQIETLGGRSIAVPSAEAALAAIRQASRINVPFAGIVIDHFMPGTDGVTLARQIREDRTLPQQRLVLASSSHLDPETRAVVEGLFDFVISKPISIAELLRVLTSERRSKPREPTEIKPKVLDRTMQPRVLVAEDNATNQMVISAMLEKLGCRVNVVADGAEALRAVQTLPYDIVLMDIMMPVMDGVEATRAIRALPSPIARVPILGLTAHASPEDHESFRRCGMNDVMSKPVTKQVLEANLAANLV